MSFSSTTTSTSVYYIASVSSSTMYYVSLYSGKIVDDYTITFGNSYTDNGDGTYTLGDTTTVKYTDWYSNYSSYTYKYTCGNSSTTCSDLQKVLSYTNTGYIYPNNKYRYGSSVTWNGSTYTLVDPIEYDEDSLSTHHYTCLTYGISCASVKYIYYLYYGTTGYYITLSNGTKDIDEALSNMFTKNTTDSDIKIGIDAWYEKYLLKYSDYLEEDTIFCNDRSIRSLGGWNPNGGSLSSYLQFKEYNVSSDLSCTNETDKFSVTNPVATLKYPVGLMTSPEMNLLGGSDIRKTGSSYWLLSPDYFGSDYARVNIVYSNGYFNDGYVLDASGVRPSVSLTTGIEYSSGDGSMSNPYIVDTSGV
jgi:hypothetical protein